MDLLAHALWAGTAGEILRRRGHVTRSAIAPIVAMGVAPDVVQMTPIVAAALSGRLTVAEVWAYATAEPGRIPHVGDFTLRLADTLHCSMHSVVVAGLATLLVLWLRPRWRYALVGWWMHILIDIPTHSAEYYPVSVFYPFSRWAVDGIAWNTPWLMGLNYTALAITALALWRTAPRAPGGGP